MARTIQVLYAASLQALWAVVEKAASAKWDATLLAIAWAVSWFLGYSVGGRLAARARGRRLLTVASIVVALAAHTLYARGADPLLPYVALTFSLALAVSAVMAAIVNEDDYAGWREGIAQAKALTALAALAFAMLTLRYTTTILASMAAVLALLAAPRFWDPLIPSSKLRLLDKFADEALAVFRGRPETSTRLVEGLALATGILAVLRVAKLAESSHPAAPLAHAAGLALGSLSAMAFRTPYPGLAALLALAGGATGILGIEPWDLALLGLGHGYADTALLVAALEVTPTGAPRYTLKALALIVPGALILSILTWAGLSLEESASAISLALLVALLRRRASWV